MNVNIKLNWRKGKTTKEVLKQIPNKIKIEIFDEFKEYNYKFVVVKFEDQKDYLIGKIYKDHHNTWCIEFWDKIRNNKNYQIITNGDIPYKYKTCKGRIEELYYINSKYIELGK